VGSNVTTKKVYAIHEHNLRSSVDKSAYETQVGEAIKNLRVPGLLHAYHLKSFKGKREGFYAVLWIFESEDAIVQNFGTPENPKWPADWLHYENDVLAQFIDEHPDKIDFSDYEAITEADY
jgi:hypothetical protein